MSALLNVAWSPSLVTEYMTCPRAWRLAHVDRVPRDHRVDGFAAELGTAAHHVLAGALKGFDVSDEVEVLRQLEVAFADAVAEAIERGSEHDPDSVERALAGLPALARRVWLVANDRRLETIEWVLVEEEISWEDAHGRRYRAHPDAAGIATQHVERWAWEFGDGHHHLEPGDLVVVDWKSGEPELHPAALALNVQLGWYARAVAHELDRDPAEAVTALGVLRDADPPGRPKRADGSAIPRRLKALDPRFLAAHGGDAEAAKGSRRAVKDEAGERVPKWTEQENPEWLAARERPRGPVLRLARVDQAAAMQTVADVIHAAEAGFFPASGAVNGACRRCRVRGSCVAWSGANDETGEADGDGPGAREDAEGDDEGSEV